MHSLQCFLHRFLALAAVPVLASSVSAATIGFQGDFDPSNFSLATNGGNGFVNTGGAPATIVLTGSDSGTGGNINTDYTTVVPGAALTLLSFDWVYTSNDSPGFDSGSYLELAGSAVFLSNTSGQSGSISIVASPGDTFGFRVNAADDGFGPGVLTITGFTADAVPPLPLGQWKSTTYDSVGNAFINNLADADNAIANGPVLGTGLVNSVNYLDFQGNGGIGNFGGDVEPFGLTGGDDDDFVVVSTGFLQISQDGDYQFRNNTDDGSRLRIDLNGNGVFEPGEDVIIDDVLSAPHDAFSGIISLVAGQYMIEHTWFEAGGGSEGELGISFDGGSFLLLGNPQSDGIGAFLQFGAYVTAEGIIPEPATATLGLMAIGGLMLRRRRAA